jgi:hypothetical protein
MGQSYSSTHLGQWQCPYCAYELKEVKAKVVNHSVNLSTVDKSMTQRRGLVTYREVHKTSR